MEVIKTIASYASYLCTILTFLALVIKPIREKILGLSATRDGLQCLLRSEIVSLYYRNLDEKALKEYEYKTLCSCFNAYIANGGNSFIKKIYSEMQEWEITK